MIIKNTSEQFGLCTKLLHWLAALLIIGLIWLGWYMVDLDYYHKWYNKSLEWHKSFGMLALLLAIIKIGWQIYNPIPGTVAGLKPWEKISSKVLHNILLVLMVLIPASGYLISTSAGKGVEIFDWISVPVLVPESDEFRDIAIELHFYMAYGIVILVLGHAVAAIKHELINRDGTLKRMIWG